MRRHHLELVPGDARQEARWEGDLGGASFQALSRATGTEFKHVALDHLERVAAAAGVAVVVERRRRLDIWPVDALVTTGSGRPVVVVAHGCIDDSPTAGLRRVDTVQKVLATVYGLAAEHLAPVLVVTSHLPERDSQAARLLARAGTHLGAAFTDVVATANDFAGTRRLGRLLAGELGVDVSAPWRAVPRGRQLELFTPGGC